MTLCLLCGSTSHFMVDCEVFKQMNRSSDQGGFKHQVVDVVGRISAKESECDGPIVAMSNCVDGLYLESSLCGMQISCLVDTGANKSILHQKKYFAISAGVRLVPSGSHIIIANGDTIPALGQTQLTLAFPGIGAISHPVIVADTEESLILGHDFLMQNKCVINIAERKILFDGKPVECSLQNKLSSLFRVRVSESVVTPTNSEMIVPGYICRGDNEVLPRLAIVESTEGVGDKGLLLARSVVAPSSQIIPLCVLNLDGKAKTLYKSTVVGTCDSVLEVFDSVSSDHETSAAKVGKVEHSDNNSSDLPDHLKLILEDCE